MPELIFLGTPEFAVPTLDRLLAMDAPIRMVVTQPDRPRGRGRRLAAAPVKLFAEQRGLPVIQPEKIGNPEVVKRLDSLGAACAVLVAYGQMIPRGVLGLFPLGVLNLHPSLLPQYRGAAPIQRALLNGETLTGVSIMLLDEGMDSGPVLAQVRVPIGALETFGSLHRRLAEIGADLLCATLRDWHRHKIHPQAQEAAGVTYAPPIAKEELRLDWRLPAKDLVNRIRAFDPAPGANCTCRGKRLKCFDAGMPGWEADGSPGLVLGRLDRGLVVLAGDRRALTLGELQIEGQRRLPTDQFLLGHPIEQGERLG